MKTKQAYPDKKLLALMIKYDISEKLALELGQLTVSMAQLLFEKWKTNFVAHRETLTEIDAEKPKLFGVIN